MLRNHSLQIDIEQGAEDVSSAGVDLFIVSAVSATILVSQESILHASQIDSLHSDSSWVQPMKNNSKR